MADLFMMCGVPGSGKSTWAKNHLRTFDRYISRDDIRFSMVKENEEYFSKENEVFREFCYQINKNLEDGYDTFADATHISKNSRAKLINNVRGYENIYIIVIEKPLMTIFEQNEKRAGTRSYVPKSVIRRMKNQFEFPTYEEGFKTIFRVVSDEEPIQIIKSYEEDK